MPTTDELLNELKTLQTELTDMAQTLRTNNDRDDNSQLTPEEQALLQAIQAQINSLNQTLYDTAPNGTGEAPPSLPSLNAHLGANVGAKRAPNDPGDVALVIQWLNNWGYAIASDADEATLIAAIKQFQEEKLGFRRQDGVISPGGMTWKVLSAAPTEVSSLGIADNETEEQLLHFQEETTYVGVRINPGEEPAQYVDVTPPYVNKNNDDFARAEENRANNRAVRALITGQNLRNAKSTPVGIRNFLEAAIEGGHIPVGDRTAQGMRDFLHHYGVGTDCNGLAFQALNFLDDGNLTHEPRQERELWNGHGLGKPPGEYDPDLYDIVARPGELRAGDFMYRHQIKKEDTRNNKEIFRHVRVITDVDLQPDGRVLIMTVESGSDDGIVDGQFRPDGNGGVGDTIWRYDTPNELGLVWRSIDGGNTWEKDRHDWVYYRPK